MISRRGNCHFWIWADIICECDCGGGGGGVF
jgi:hypothetical protein